MKEFIEKLIGRLEEYCAVDKGICDCNGVCSECDFKESIKIVNQLAEEYKQDKTFQYVLLQTDILKRMGIDISCKWETATQQACALNEAYLRGRQDERDRFTELQEQHNNDFCEWRLCDEEANVYDTTCRNPHILIEGNPTDNRYEYCPYCGKKIKIAPYQPKGENE